MCNCFTFRPVDDDFDDKKAVDEKGHADISIQGNILRVDRTGALNISKNCLFKYYFKNFPFTNIH